MIFVAINNQLIREEKALISIKERGFRFGDGVFETCKVTDYIIYNWKAHFNRLKYGLEAIKIQANLDNLKEICQKLINKNSHENGLIRIYISRGIGSLGYLPINNIKPLIIVETLKNPKLGELPIKLFLSKLSKISLNSLPVNCKLAQGLNSTLAKMEAVEQGYFDSILLNQKSEICETSGANIFWVKNNILYTPDEECGILLGTTRQKIIDFSPLKVIRAKAQIVELSDADEVFLTNASLGVIAVDQFMDKKYSQKKYAQIFFDLLKEDIKNYVNLERSS